MPSSSNDDVSQEEQVKTIGPGDPRPLRHASTSWSTTPAIGVYKSVLDTSSEDWDRCLDVNLKGQFLCSKYVIPHMQDAG